MGACVSQAKYRAVAVAAAAKSPGIWVGGLPRVSPLGSLLGRAGGGRAAGPGREGGCLLSDKAGSSWGSGCRPARPVPLAGVLGAALPVRLAVPWLRPPVLSTGSEGPVALRPGRCPPQLLKPCGPCKHRPMALLCSGGAPGGAGGGAGRVCQMGLPRVRRSPCPALPGQFVGLRVPRGQRGAARPALRAGRPLGRGTCGGDRCGTLGALGARPQWRTQQPLPRFPPGCWGPCWEPHGRGAP